MRYSLLALSSFMFLVAPSAGAQSSDYPAPEGVMSTVQVSAPPRAYHFSKDDVDYASGHYEMQNGWSLNVTASSSGIDATIDGQRSMHLIALGPNRYVSRSGNVVMDFDVGGDPNVMQMSYVPRSNLAAVIVVRSTMASR